jgi:hypothetical protein
MDKVKPLKREPAPVPVELQVAKAAVEYELAIRRQERAKPLGKASSRAARFRAFERLRKMASLLIPE